MSSPSRIIANLVHWNQPLRRPPPLSHSALHLGSLFDRQFGCAKLAPGRKMWQLLVKNASKSGISTSKQDEERLHRFYFRKKNSRETRAKEEEEEVEIEPSARERKSIVCYIINKFRRAGAGLDWANIAAVGERCVDDGGANDMAKASKKKWFIDFCARLRSTSFDIDSCASRRNGCEWEMATEQRLIIITVIYRLTSSDWFSSLDCNCTLAWMFLSGSPTALLYWEVMIIWITAHKQLLHRMPANPRRPDVHMENRLKCRYIVHVPD